MKKEVNIKEVKTNPNNPRTIKDSNFKKLEKSIKELSGFLKLRPIIVDEDMMVLGGNMRLKAALSVGKEKVWIDMFTKDMADKMNQEATEQGRKTKTYSDFCKEIIVKDNSGFGEWDIEILTNDYNKEDLIEWGFDSEEVDFFEPETTEGLIEDDEIPEVTEAITKEGDLWILGDHRLLCGDSTKKNDVERLMDGNKADLLLTDPPYGISATKMTLGTGKKEFHRGDWDNEKPDITLFLKYCDKQIFWGGNYFADVLPINNDWLCWHKKNDNLSFSEFELAWTNIKKNCRILSHHWGGEKKKHPTQKPLEVIKWCIELEKDAKNILDVFLGSGTTLIACEKTNRKCYGMELDPHYCDVIVKRWEEYTGKKAHKEELIATN